MENSKHTSGPWEADRVGRGAVYYWTIYETAWSGKIADLGSGKESEDEANARLIAAAPDLLAALEDLHAAHRAFSSADNWTTFDEDARCAACAAIAKARGE